MSAKLLYDMNTSCFSYKTEQILVILTPIYFDLQWTLYCIALRCFVKKEYLKGERFCFCNYYLYSSWVKQ